MPRTPDQWPLVVDDKQSAPRTLTSGVTQNTDVLQTVGGAQHGSVMNVDLTNPNVRLGVVQAGDHLTTPQDEVLTSMARRTGAVAGINGDFFEIYGSGRPLGMVTINDRSPRWSPRTDSGIGQSALTQICIAAMMTPALAALVVLRWIHRRPPSAAAKRCGVRCVSRRPVAGDL